MSKRNGFTLIEIVVVMCIIAVLAVMSVPRFVDITSESRISTFEYNHNVLRSALSMYATDHSGKMPNDMDSLAKYIADIDSDATGGAVAKHFLDKPKGAKYEWTNKKLTSTLSDVDKVADNRVGVYDPQNRTYTMTFIPE